MMGEQELFITVMSISFLLVGSWHRHIYGWCNFHSGMVLVS